MLRPPDTFDTRTIVAWTLGAFVGSTALLLGVAMAMAASVGIDDLRMIGTFMSDEMGGVERVSANINGPNFSPNGFFFYGYVSYGLTAIFCHGLKLLGLPVGPREIVLTGRALSLLAHFGTAGLIALSCRGIGLPRGWALLGGLWSLFTPALVSHGMTFKPDALQVTLLAGALLLAIRGEPNDRLYIRLGIVTGLAFGTKYAAAFATPWLGLAVALRDPRSWRQQWRIPQALRMLGGFLGAWLFTNPYVLWDWAVFLEQLGRQRFLLARGLVHQESDDPSQWLGILVKVLGETGLPLLTLLLVGAVVGLWAQAKRTIGPRPFEWPIVAACVGVTLATLLYLVVAVNMRRERFLMPILPFAIVGGLWGGRWLVERVQRLLPGWPKSTGPIVGVLGACVLMYPQVARTQRYISPRFARLNAPQLQVGYFLRGAFPPDTTIIADKYTWVPAEFWRAELVWELPPGELERKSAKVWILNKNLSRRFAWKAQGSRWEQRDWVLGQHPDARSVRERYDLLLSPKGPWCTRWEDEFAVVMQPCNEPGPAARLP